MLDTLLIEKLLSIALARGGDFAEVFCERRRSAVLRLDSGVLAESVYSLNEGVGIRVMCGEAVGYGFSDDLSESALAHAARSASLIASGGACGIEGVPLASGTQTFGVLEGLTLSASECNLHADVLARADVAAREYDSRITGVSAWLSDDLQEVCIANSGGLLVYDRRPMTVLNVRAYSFANGRRGHGFAGDGGRTGMEALRVHTPESIARDAARIAVSNLDALEAPSGEMEMLVGSGSGGVLLHEAVGHGLESDFNRHGTSPYSGRIGERVASELVTICDDGTLPDELGSFAVDDEGQPTACSVLVEGGVLCGYMHDRHNAKFMRAALTGNGRRQSFRCPPQPRMRNTYMRSGTSTVEEMLKSMRRGVYAKAFTGGQVDIGRGNFAFMIAEGYLVEGGKVTAPIKNATIVGNGPDIMRRVVAVGNDWRMANSNYTCAKGGQSIPVGVGMPTIKISSITVGGSKTA